MKALRICILQRSPLAPVTWLAGDEDQQAASNQIMLRIREAQDRFLRDADDFEEANQAAAADDLHPFPLSVSLVPVQLALVATQRHLERGLSTFLQAEDSLAQAICEGDAIVAERRASVSVPATSQASPPTVQGLRAQFESLQQQIESNTAARRCMFGTEGTVAMLKVVAALEGNQRLAEEQLQSFCKRLHSRFLELNAAFQNISHKKIALDPS